jgi:predicted NUDIX family NTP pyrophosphohydrolase
MPRHSAGLLLFRRSTGTIEVFLVHPGGPFWRKRDDGAWSIPKGEFDDKESPVDAAVRELREETGFGIDGPFLALGMIRQAGGKFVQAFAVAADVDPTKIVANSFEIEWPPRSGRRATFPEVDRAAWFSIEQARTKINPAQTEFLDRLLAMT